MGNTFTVENKTSSEIEFTYFLAGSKSNSKTINLQSGQIELISFSSSLSKSKTLIVGINNKAFRAIRNNRKICVVQIQDEIIIQDVTDQCQIYSNINSIIETDEKIRNWNLNKDENVNNDYKKAINGWIKMMNNVSSFVVNTSVNYVPSIPLDKDISRLVGKLLLNYIINAVKITEIELSDVKDVHSIDNLRKIQYKIIGISRAIETDYPSLTGEINLDKKDKIIFLHKQLTKIANIELLLSIENCHQEQAILLYGTAIGVAINIFDIFRSLNDDKPSQFEEKYLPIFADNLRELWTNIINGITKDCKKKTEGILFKSCELRFRNQFIYKVKSFSKSRVVKRINDINEAFKKNREYQMNYLYGHPNELTKNWENRLLPQNGTR